MSARSYCVEYQRDLRPGSRLDWTLYTSGPGHWCVGGDVPSKFTTEAAAIQAGKTWAKLGIQPCEQDRAFHAAIAESAACDTRCLAAVDELAGIREGGLSR